MEFDLNLALQVAEKAAREAGRIQREYAAEDYAVERKGRIDIVTEVDIKCEKAIVGVIGETFPDHGTLAEEEGGRRADAEYKWVIDPIDGTTNYSHGFPMYCASVALEERGRIILGAVYDPTRDEMFAASRGNGATLNGRPIRVSERDELIDSLLATGFPYTIKTEKRNNLKEFAALAMRAQAIRRPGAAALDLCYVACGRLDGFWEFHLKPWDMAAGAFIVEEAGGRVTNAAGGALDIYDPQIIASNGRIHGDMLEVIREA